MKVSRSLAAVFASAVLALSMLALMPGAAGAQPRNCYELAYMQSIWLTQAQEFHIRWEESGDIYWLVREIEAIEDMQEVEVEMMSNHC
jgi:hypothetical protein